MNPRVMRWVLLITITMLGVLSPGQVGADPGGLIVVDTLVDSLVGGDGQCTLREAIHNANSDLDLTGGDCASGSDADLIVLPAGTLTLAIAGTDEDANATGDLDVRGNITLQGAGPAQTVIDGNQLDRVLHIAAAGAIVEVRGLTVTNGRLPGALLSPPAVFAYGGAGIFNDHGTLTLVDAAVTANAIDTDDGGRGSGGGLLTHGGITMMQDVLIADNQAPWGGGMALSHKFSTWMDTTIESSTIAGNSADHGGGGIWGYGEAPNQNLVTISDSTIEGNQVLSAGLPSSGGGLAFSFVNLTLLRSLIANNVISGVGLPAMNVGGGLTVTNGAAIVANSTLSGNQVVGADSWPHGVGGGLAVMADSLVTSVSLVNSTVAGNTAGQAGGGIYVRNDGGPRAELLFKNSIVAGNGVFTGPGENCAIDSPDAHLVSLDHNLEDLDSCHFDQPSDQVNVDPKLGPLQDNGGPTRTHGLLDVSPAIDAAHDDTCAAPPISNMDQRGVARPQGAHSDIGAYEVGEGATAVRLSTLTSEPAPVPLPLVGASLLAMAGGLALLRRRGQSV